MSHRTRFGNLRLAGSSSNYKEYQEEYLRRFKDYHFWISQPGNEEINPESDLADVFLNLRGGELLSGQVTTLNYLNELMKKNTRTGECANGSYLAIPRIIVVQKIDKPTIKRTLDDLISLMSIEDHFN